MRRRGAGQDGGDGFPPARPAGSLASPSQTDAASFTWPRRPESAARAPDGRRRGKVFVWRLLPSLDERRDPGAVLTCSGPTASRRVSRHVGSNRYLRREEERRDELDNAILTSTTQTINRLERRQGELHAGLQKGRS